MEKVKKPPKEYSIKLTKMEAKALFSTARQMEHDMYDYFSFMGNKRRDKFIAAYESALNKLQKL